MVTVSGSAIENGPGPQVRASSPGGGRNSRTTAFGTPSHGLSSIVRQTIITISPPGRRLLRMFLSAATGFSKNCVPKREKQRSKSPSNG